MRTAQKSLESIPLALHLAANLVDKWSKLSSPKPPLDLGRVQALRETLHPLLCSPQNFPKETGQLKSGWPSFESLWASNRQGSRPKQGGCNDLGQKV